MTVAIGQLRLCLHAVALDQGAQAIRYCEQSTTYLPSVDTHNPGGKQRKKLLFLFRRTIVIRWPRLIAKVVQDETEESRGNRGGRAPDGCLPATTLF